MLIAAPDAAILICQKEKKTHTKSSVSDLKLFFCGMGGGGGAGEFAKISILGTLA
jgi:hypothetical protein